MTKYGRYIKSSFGDIRCCDESTVITDPGNPEVTYGWRALSTSKTCVLDGNNHNTGYVHVVTLEKYDTSTGVATGDTKPNNPSDPDYVADYIDLNNCPLQPPTGNSTIHIANYVDNTPIIHIVNSDGLHEYTYGAVGPGTDFYGDIAPGTYFVNILHPENYTPPEEGNAIRCDVNGIIQENPSHVSFIRTGIIAPIDIYLDKII